MNFKQQSFQTTETEDLEVVSCHNARIGPGEPTDTDKAEVLRPVGSNPCSTGWCVGMWGLSEGIVWAGERKHVMFAAELDTLRKGEKETWKNVAKEGSTNESGDTICIGSKAGRNVRIVIEHCCYERKKQVALCSFQRSTRGDRITDKFLRTILPAY